MPSARARAELLLSGLAGWTVLGFLYGVAPIRVWRRELTRHLAARRRQDVTHIQRA